MIRSKRLFAVSTLSVIAGTLSFGALSSLLVNLDFERGEVGWQNWGDGDIRQEYHAIDMNANGNFVITWMDDRDDYGSDIFFQRYNPVFFRQYIKNTTLVNLFQIGNCVLAD